MKVTYICHSCFLVELEHTLLLFDYWKGRLPNLDPQKKLYVFSSHAHHDHFSFDIFQIQHPNTQYILSSDIRKAHNAKDFSRHGVEPDVYDQICFLKPHQQTSVDSLQIETFDSTDAGVAFLIQTESKSILHMGDLHWWVWDGEPDAENQRIESKWNQELALLSGRHLNCLFAVLDPRQEDDFWRGLDQLALTVDADAIYPMHFWDHPELIDRLREMPCSAPYRDKLPPVSFYLQNSGTN